MAAQRKLRVFLCYASQDKLIVQDLYKRLHAEGWIDPWLDSENLLPGQNRDMEIEKAIEAADAVIVCLSSTSTTKEGYVQKEMRHVMNIALEKLEGVIFIMPLRLDECDPPRSLRAYQYVDYFPEAQRKPAMQSLLAALKIRAESISGDIKPRVESSGRFVSTPKNPSAPRPAELTSTGGEESFSILFLAADPTDAARLRLGEELREIQEKLQLSKQRDRFNLQQRMSVRPVDISQALLDIQPRIVHFSGHGLSSGELCFEDHSGKVLPIKPEALAALFEQFSGQVECVLMNACFSEAQAHAIGGHIPYVIGMNKQIGDKAAISFAIGFYQALGAGRSIEDAYKLGCVQIQLYGIDEHLTPVLLKNNG
jgi:hypothetical protein